MPTVGKSRCREGSYQEGEEHAKVIPIGKGAHG